MISPRKDSNDSSTTTTTTTTTASTSNATTPELEEEEEKEVVEEETQEESEYKDEIEIEENQVIPPVIVNTEFDNWANDAMQDWKDKALLIDSFVRNNIKDRNQLEAKKALERSKLDAENGNNKKRKGKAVVTTKSDRKKSKVDSTKKGSKNEESDVNEEDIDYSLDLSQVTATLRDYQLAGVRWLVTLQESGLNGILADEMGLGKTLQTIAFLSVLRQRGFKGIKFVVCPKSVLHVWKDEIARFCPSLHNIVYEGNPEERALLRQEHLGFKSAITHSPSNLYDPPIVITSYEILVRDTKYFKKMRHGDDNRGIQFIVVDESHKLKNPKSKLMAALRELPSENRLLLTGTPLQNKLPELFSLLSYLSPSIFPDVDAFMDRFDTGSILQDNTFSKVQTMHSILKPFMLRRIKSEVEKSLPLLKEYVLTAPLTKRQAELYSAVLDKNIRALLIRENAPAEISSSSTLPPPSSTQVEVIDLAEEEEDEESVSTPRSKSKSTKSISTNRSKRTTTQRGGKNKVYRDYDDADVERDEESGEENFITQEVDIDERSAEEVGRAHALAKAVRSANAKKFGNPLMQLRKIANHPYLLDGGFIPGTSERILDKTLMTQSGKMLLLDRLLDGLFKKGHKVLIFSQFVETLDLLEDWADFKKIDTFRLDGQTSSTERRHAMTEFNTNKGPDAVKLFLLSTRAGGEGISLLAADTVILFDSDWNPSKDLQAAARCHRIGQTKPVLVFRLISAGTIEGKILERAGEKRALEGLVIGRASLQGRPDEDIEEDDDVDNGEEEEGDESMGIRTSTNLKKKSRGPTLEQLTETLLKKDFENVTLAQEGDTFLSDAQLELLLDRSNETMLSKTSWVKKASKLADTKTGLEVFTSAKETQGEGDADDDVNAAFEEGVDGKAEGDDEEL